MVEGPTVSLKTPSSWVLQHCSSLVGILLPLPLTPHHLPPPPKRSRPLIKAGLSATAAHQGGSSPSPTTTRLVGRPSLMNTYGCKHTGANAGTHTQMTPSPPAPPPPPPSQVARSCYWNRMFFFSTSVHVNKLKDQQTCDKVAHVLLLHAWVCVCVCVGMTETGDVIQSARHALTEQTHYALGATFSTYKQTAEQTNITACLHMYPWTSFHL